MSEYRVASIADLIQNRGRLFMIGEEEITLFRIGSQVFAVGNVCPHQRFSKIHEGIVEEFSVTCPLHGWKFDLRTGQSMNAGGRLRTYPVTIHKDDV